jgi:hypothetical protein
MSGSALSITEISRVLDVSENTARRFASVTAGIKLRPYVTAK